MNNTTERVFPKGVRIFKAHEKAPSWVKGSMVITLNDLVTFCKENPGYLTEYKGQKQLKLQLQESKDGMLNVVVDTYKRDTVNSSDNGSDLPF